MVPAPSVTEEARSRPARCTDRPRPELRVPLSPCRLLGRPWPGTWKIIPDMPTVAEQTRRSYALAQPRECSRACAGPGYPVRHQDLCRCLLVLVASPPVTNFADTRLTLREPRSYARSRCKPLGMPEESAALAVQVVCETDAISFKLATTSCNSASSLKHRSFAACAVPFRGSERLRCAKPAGGTYQRLN